MSAVIPSRDDDYHAGGDVELTPDVWNGVFGDIGSRLREREQLEASFEALVALGIQASLDYIQATVAPQLAGLQADIAAARDEIDEILATGTAPNAEKLGGHAVGYFATAASQTATADALATHSADTGNPHEVTAAQVGATTVQDVLDLLHSRDVGTIVDWGFDTLPDHLAELDGSLLSRALFPVLWAKVQAHAGVLLMDDVDWLAARLQWSRGDGATTFRMPDLRGTFSRAANSGAAVDPGRVLGTFQGSANLSHTHTGTTALAGWHAHTGSTYGAGYHAHTYQRFWVGNVDHTHSTGAGHAASHPDGGSLTAAGGTDPTPDHAHTLAINGEGNHTHTFTTAAAGGGEARPINTAIRRCVVVG